MPTKPPSDRTPAKGEHSSPVCPELCRGEFCRGAPGLASGFSPIMRNEPNSHPAQDQNAQNEPNYRPANSQKQTANSQNMRNACCGEAERRRKPNSTPARPIAKSQQPKAAFTKRTQFTVPLASRRLPHPQKCKTNPISTAADLWRTKKCETNPISTGFGFLPDLSACNCAKQTQFPHRTSLASPDPQTDARSHYAQNEPNFRPVKG